MKIVRFWGGQFRWLKHCRGALTQRGGSDSRTARESSFNNIIKMEKPVKSMRISAGTRVYYIDVHVDRKGQKYMSISEIPTGRCPGDKRRQRIFIHAENIRRFTEAVNEVANQIKDAPEG